MTIEYFLFFPLVFSESLYGNWRDQNPYCNLTCSAFHTACKQNDCNATHILYCTEDSEIIRLSNNEQNKVVDLINTFRSKVAIGKQRGFPKANQMMAVQYDDHLEHIAQCWSNECTLGHDNCRSTYQFEDIGQNMMYFDYKKSSEIKDNIEEAMETWAKEIRRLPLARLRNYVRSKAYENVTQLLWDSTQSVGCGRTYFDNSILLICNFGPGGNVQNLPVYIEGEPCSNCSGIPCNSKYRGLCGEIALKPFSVEIDGTCTFSYSAFLFYISLMLTVIHKI